MVVISHELSVNLEFAHDQPFIDPAIGTTHSFSYYHFFPFALSGDDVV
jgi:hypothetical protein